MTAILRTIIAGCLLLAGLQTKAQLLEKKETAKPDILEMSDRFSLRTNSLDWVMLMPNISAEFDLGKENHNHWTVGLGLRYNWQTKHEFKPAWVYNLAEARGELRYYWHTQKINKEYNINPHEELVITDDTIYYKKKLLGRLFSTRRPELKHPNTTYYRGVYVSADKYSFLFGGESGYQGTALIAGFLYGIVKPLYEFKSGNTLDLDLGFNIGVCLTKYDKYYHDRESNCYPVMSHGDWRPLFFPVVSELRFAFIYRFGDYPLTKKYRWKIEVDEAYRSEQKHIADSIDKVIKDKENLIQEIKDVRQKFDNYYKDILLLPATKEKAKEELAQIRKSQEQAQRAKQAAEEEKLKKKEAKKKKPAKEEKAKKEEKSSKEEKDKVEENKKAEENKVEENKEEEPKVEETPTSETPEQKEQEEQEQKEEQKEES